MEVVHRIRAENELQSLVLRLQSSSECGSSWLRDQVPLLREDRQQRTQIPAAI